MTTEQKIISYLGQITQGKVKLSPHIAARLIDIVLNSGHCRVILHRYSYLKKAWEVMLTINTTAEQQAAVLQQSLLHKPADNFYRYDLYNEANELQGYIYSLNPELF